MSPLVWGEGAWAQPTADVFPLRIHVAGAVDGAATSVVTDAWLDTQVATANALFAPHGVSFIVDERRPLADGHAQLETRADRHALGALLDPARIDVFIVRSLRDVDDPEQMRIGSPSPRAPVRARGALPYAPSADEHSSTQMRRGVHWRPAGHPGAHFVVVSAISGSTVLAHELGHYFGNPHSPTPGNIMSYERGEVPPFFDAPQARRIRRAASRFRRAGAPAAAARP